MYPVYEPAASVQITVFPVHSLAGWRWSLRPCRSPGILPSNPGEINVPVNRRHWLMLFFHLKTRGGQGQGSENMYVTRVSRWYLEGWRRHWPWMTSLFHQTVHSCWATRSFKHLFNPNRQRVMWSDWHHIVHSNWHFFFDSTYCSSSAPADYKIVKKII